MSDLLEKAENLQLALNKALKQIKFSDLVSEEGKLKELSESKEFWGNSTTAQEIMKQLSKLDRRLKTWRQIQKDLAENMQLIRMNDTRLEHDLRNQLQAIEAKFNKLKTDLKFTGQFDDHDAIVSIYAGAGGTDAQDWTQILLRMYSRWTEQNGYELRTITDSAGEEAGLKSVTIEISGDYIYGKLKGEHGVHRLVRLSPFNANHLRETSFAKVEVLPKIDKPNDLVIDDKDLNIDVFRSGGHGGQSVNTTDSAVRVTHIPTNISIAIQNERSQLQNKETALTILRSRLAQLELEQHQSNLRALKGPNQSAEWGNQIRSYVLHPYKQVKDLRSRYETSDVDGVLDGKIDDLIAAYLEHTLQV